jgi:hypothetical protein
LIPAHAPTPTHHTVARNVSFRSFLQTMTRTRYRAERVRSYAHVAAADITRHYRFDGGHSADEMTSQVMTTALISGPIGASDRGHELFLPWFAGGDIGLSGGLPFRVCDH